MNVLSGFFIVRGVRRTGLGLRTAKQLIDRYPGPWEVALQAENTIAVHFWRRVAEEVGPDVWREERRAVPGRPDLPPDVWISLPPLP